MAIASMTPVTAPASHVPLKQSDAQNTTGCYGHGADEQADPRLSG